MKMRPIPYGQDETGSFMYFNPNIEEYKIYRYTNQKIKTVPANVHSPISDQLNYLPTDPAGLIPPVCGFQACLPTDPAGIIPPVCGFQEPLKDPAGTGSLCLWA